MTVEPSSHLAGNAIILAAGKGTRMGTTDIPKVLFPLANRPMLSYVLDNLAAAGIERPIIVVGFLANKVKETFGTNYDYVTQHEQNGTATAVLAAKELLSDKLGITVIASGDQPFISSGSIDRLLGAVSGDQAILALLAGQFESTEFDAFGRVIVAGGSASAIVEAKNASPEQLEGRLFNLGTYAVDNRWLWHSLNEIKKNPLTGEYYLTDLVALAASQGERVAVVETTDEHEAIGINTPEHLALAERQLFAHQ